MNVIPFPDRGQRESDRIKAIHHDHLPFHDLPAELGTPEEWFWSAVSHAKVQSRAGDVGGTVEISTAALTLLVWKLEELLVGGEPIRLGAVED